MIVLLPVEGLRGLDLAPLTKGGTKGHFSQGPCEYTNPPRPLGAQCVGNKELAGRGRGKGQSGSFTAGLVIECGYPGILVH